MVQNSAYAQAGRGGGRPTTGVGTTAAIRAQTGQFAGQTQPAQNRGAQAQRMNNAIVQGQLGVRPQQMVAF